MCAVLVYFEVYICSNLELKMLKNIQLSYISVSFTVQSVDNLYSFLACRS